MDIAGYAASLLIGISLGLIGGGGSILTVPVLVYLFGMEAASATVYSLFIVGSTSAIGSISYWSKRLVSIRTAAVFGIASVLAVFLTRKYIVTAIPQYILSIGGLVVTKGMLLLLLFAILMVFASYSMIRKKRDMAVEGPGKQPHYPMVLLQGIGTGIVTGLVGAGGGFLIIPALVNFLKMPMKAAVGTSLVIIAVNSLSGFFFSLSGTGIQWPLLLRISAIAVSGILIGGYIATKIEGRKLKPVFGWFVLIMGVYILIKEILFR